MGEDRTLAGRLRGWAGWHDMPPDCAAMMRDAAAELERLSAIFGTPWEQLRRERDEARQEAARLDKMVPVLLRQHDDVSERLRRAEDALERAEKTLGLDDGEIRMLRERLARAEEALGEALKEEARLVGERMQFRPRVLPDDEAQAADAMRGMGGRVEFRGGDAGTGQPPRRRYFVTGWTEFDGRVEPGGYVRLGPAGAVWLVHATTGSLAPDLALIEVEPVDPHDVPMEAVVVELPGPVTEVAAVDAKQWRVTAGES